MDKNSTASFQKTLRNSDNPQPKKNPQHNIYENKQRLLKYLAPTIPKIHRNPQSKPFEAGQIKEIIQSRPITRISFENRRPYFLTNNRESSRNQSKDNSDQRPINQININELETGNPSTNSRPVRQVEPQTDSIVKTYHNYENRPQSPKNRNLGHPRNPVHSTDLEDNNNIRRIRILVFKPKQAELFNNSKESTTKQKEQNSEPQKGYAANHQKKKDFQIKTNQQETPSNVNTNQCSNLNSGNTNHYHLATKSTYANSENFKENLDDCLDLTKPQNSKTTGGFGNQVPQSKGPPYDNHCKHYEQKLAANQGKSNAVGDRTSCETAKNQASGIIASSINNQGNCAPAAPMADQENRPYSNYSDCRTQNSADWPTTASKLRTDEEYLTHHSHLNKKPTGNPEKPRDINAFNKHFETPLKGHEKSDDFGFSPQKDIEKQGTNQRSLSLKPKNYGFPNEENRTRVPIKGDLNVLPGDIMFKPSKIELPSIQEEREIPKEISKRERISRSLSILNKMTEDQGPRAKPGHNGKKAMIYYNLGRLYATVEQVLNAIGKDGRRKGFYKYEAYIEDRSLKFMFVLDNISNFMNVLATSLNDARLRRIQVQLPEVQDVDRWLEFFNSRRVGPYDSDQVKLAFKVLEWLLPRLKQNKFSEDMPADLTYSILDLEENGESVQNMVQHQQNKIMKMNANAQFLAGKIGQRLKELDDWDPDDIVFSEKPLLHFESERHNH